MKTILALVLVHTIAGCGSSQLQADAGSGPDGQSGAVRACGASDSFAPIRIRAELPAGTPQPDPFMSPTSKVFDVMGVVSSVVRIDEPCPQECSQGQRQPGPQCPACSAGTMPSVRIAVMDGDGKIWAILVSPQGAVAEWQTAAETVLGKSISLRLAYRHGFQLQVAFGFTVSDETGLVMASDGGHFVQALGAADTPSLVVTNGSPICEESGCYLYRELSFAGATSAHVGFADGEIMVGSRRYGVRNQGASTVVDACRGSDTEEASPWSAWLRP